MIGDWARFFSSSFHVEWDSGDLFIWFGILSIFPSSFRQSSENNETSIQIVQNFNN